MNAVDIVIIVVLFLGAFSGFRRGFLVEIAAILGVVVALAVAKVGYPVVRALIVTVAAKSAWVTVISYLIVFLAVWGAVITAARLGRRVMRTLLLGGPDRIGGAVIGLLQATLVVELLLYLGKRVPNHTITHAINHSRLGPTFVGILPYIQRLFPHVTHY